MTAHLKPVPKTFPSDLVGCRVTFPDQNDRRTLEGVVVQTSEHNSSQLVVLVDGRTIYHVHYAAAKPVEGAGNKIFEDASDRVAEHLGSAIGVLGPEALRGLVYEEICIRLLAQDEVTPTIMRRFLDAMERCQQRM